MLNVERLYDRAPMMTVETDVFGGHGVEVRLPDADAFLKVKETLTRVGLQTEPGQLDQPCFILHKRGRYAIVHHLELRQLDGERVDPDDVARMLAVRNTVAGLLDQWGLVEVIDEAALDADQAPVRSARHGSPSACVEIVPHKAKSQWALNPLYQIGRGRR